MKWLAPYCQIRIVICVLLMWIIGAILPSVYAGQPACRTSLNLVQPLTTHYYAVQPQSAALQVSPADVNSIIRARQELDRLEAALTQSSLLSAQRIQAQPRVELLAPPPAQAQVQPQALKADPVATIFAKYKCDTCHQTTGHTLFTGQNLPAAKRWEVLGRVASHNMPKGDVETLTAEEVETIRAWAEQSNK